MKTNNKKKGNTAKKLIPAAMMLAVSASMLGTSTYAWFSMNKTVTATGISMTATVPNQLLIKGSAENAAYKAAILFNDSVDSAVSNESTLTGLEPVAYKTRTATSSNPNNTFKKLTTAGKAKVDEAGRVSGADVNLSSATDVENAVANQDYFYDTFTLKYAGELDANYAQPYLTITMTDADTADTESPLHDAIHIVLVDDKQTPNVYEYDMTAATGASSVYTLANQQVTAFTVDNEAIEYKVYVFYDGEDADCKNANALNIDAYSFNFSFTLEAPNAGGNGG